MKSEVSYASQTPDVFNIYIIGPVKKNLIRKNNIDIFSL